MNMRAICPNCGGKIHTQPKGLGHFTWARSGPLVKTGTTCEHWGAHIRWVERRKAPHPGRARGVVTLFLRAGTTVQGTSMPTVATQPHALTAER